MEFLTHKIYEFNAQKWIERTLFVGWMQYGLKTLHLWVKCNMG